MHMPKNKLKDLDKEQLLQQIAEIRKQLVKKKSDHTKTKKRLSFYRHKLQKLKAIVSFQRSRILQLYRGEQFEMLK